MSDVAYAIRMAKEHYTDEGFDHAMRVMTYVAQNRMIPYEKRDFCLCLAVMHDLLEDTEYTKSAILGMEDAERFVRCLDILTKSKDVKYNDYVRNINDLSSSYPEAYWVKLADMKDHLMLTETLTDKLKEKYLGALKYLL